MSSVLALLRKAVRHRGGTVEDIGHVTNGDRHVAHARVSGLDEADAEYVRGYTRVDDEPVTWETWGDDIMFDVDLSVER